MGVCARVCGRKLGKACALRNWFGGEGGRGGEGGGGLGLGDWAGVDWDWTGLDWLGLDWIGLMRGAQMQDARCGQQGSAEKDQAGMKGAGARLMMNGLG